MSRRPTLNGQSPDGSSATGGSLAFLFSEAPYYYDGVSDGVAARSGLRSHLDGAFPRYPLIGSLSRSVY